MFLLNIGLMTNDNQPVSLPWLRSALTLARVQVKRSAVHQSRTEPTFAAELREPVSFAALEKLARDLKQDCIAYYNSDAHDDDAGMLAGPKPWGAFDADQFLLPSGGFLGDALRLARMNDDDFGAMLEARTAFHLSRGHYIGLDRPAWDAPLENGDES